MECGEYPKSLVTVMNITKSCNCDNTIMMNIKSCNCDNVIMMNIESCNCGEYIVRKYGMFAQSVTDNDIRKYGCLIRSLKLQGNLSSIC